MEKRKPAHEGRAFQTTRAELTENGKNCGFKYEKDMSVRSYEENEFTRTITFPTNIERIEIIKVYYIE